MNEREEKAALIDYSADRLVELRDEIIEKIEEMRGELQSVADEIREIDVAEAYWLGHIESCLSEDAGNPYDTSVDHSVVALRKRADEIRAEVSEAVSSADEIKKSIAEEDDFEEWDPDVD